MKENKQILIIGGMCNYPIVLAELLERHNINAAVVNRATFFLGKWTRFFYSKNSFLPEKSKDFYQLSKDYDLLIFVGSSIVYELGIRRSIRVLYERKPIIAVTLGSDITEFVKSRGIYSFLYKRFLEKSKFILMVPYFYGIKNIMEKKFHNISLARLPYLCKKSDSFNAVKSKKVIFSHCSHIDFKVHDSGAYRNSSKGNDRFIYAFLRAVKSGLNIHCNILDRGPDRDQLKEIIRNLGGEHYFTWLPERNQDTITAIFQESDCVVDQFDVGGFGMIAMEAMAQAKPVMIYIDKNCWPLVYAEEPPVINCHTEDEIYNAILEWADKKKLQELGEKAEKWVRKYHDVHTADFSEFILRVCLAAGLEWPRTDLAKQGE